MLRSYLLLNLISLDYLPLMDRWLYKDHAMETMNQVGPLLHRYTTYRAVPGPQGAVALGYYNWRMTEHWWAQSPFHEGVMGHGSAMAEIWPEGYKKALGIPTGESQRCCKWAGKAPVFIFVPVRPTEDFKGRSLTINDGTIIRWLTIFKYPEGVSVEEGDDWYINVHAPEVMEQPGLKRFFSFAAVEPSSKVGPFARVSELWYENHSVWQHSVVDSPLKYTPPSWAQWGHYPFLQPDVDFVSTFLLERPECNFLRDYKGYNVTA